MRFRDWATRVLLISLMFTALSVALLAGKISQSQSNTITPSNQEITTAWSEYPQVKLQSAENQAEKSPDLPKSPIKTNKAAGRYKTTQAFAQYQPRYEIASVDPSNYGQRYAKDINGVLLNNQPIIVLHETGYSASSAVNFFQMPHEDENVQASYHALIKLDGTIIYLVPPDKRAFGAANSVFDGIDGAETVQTNPNFPSSVNNFAYHVSLETPPDGRGNNYQKAHSGYTEAQYNSLAWLIAQSQVPSDRITTHQAVDRSGQKVDPVSFDFDKFLTLLDTFRQLSPIYRANK
ncbi:N-acetylmuramoyl-L-alanine amidase [Nostocaceae cyanobacterium CENA357]|uniref:N-acetylmuramoyl-L-alanine amidase n=1 Tax=Atlanticothrix silvestris CENA357 TaxID=1725252 RepID=A0A8J7L5V2_9CYAN|nr:peptidoglycan recognition family protein [Atlanticothrix silvestris]MBH8555062.1 N-acetylmuramoyl-L-alanine amidase [Atlanticothrix silvestris CENA357]